MIVIAVANGVLREAWLRKQLSVLRAHQVSTLTLIALLGVYIGAVVRLLPPASAGQALGVGALWLVLTLAFEFLFGHFVSRLPWSKLVQDYDLRGGRLWVLVPVWVLVAPYLFFRLQD